MKVVLAAINSKFIHTCPALYSLKAYSEKRAFGAQCPDPDISIAEFSLANSRDHMLRRLYGESPDVVCLSVYIWNAAEARAVISAIRRILPGCVVVAGGPEASHDPESFIKSGAEFVVIGEGEATFYELLSHLTSRSRGINASPYAGGIDGLAFPEDGLVRVNRPRKPLCLDEIPFPYKDPSVFENRLVYYESSRGFPFGCRYCPSSAESGVRYLSLERVKSDLGFFLAAKPGTVKFADRTFNSDIKRAKAIWGHLIERDNGRTRFHFEIAADLLDDEAIGLLGKTRPGLFQFEAGVQTACESALAISGRKTSLIKLRENVKALQDAGNARMHLDLIAGLPGEDYESFKKSFDFVYSLEPGHFQLGFLKLLKGTEFRERASSYGVVYREDPPYEVIRTREMEYGDLLRLKAVEDMLELFYNNGRHSRILKFITGMFGSAFEMYDALADFWYGRGLHEKSHGKYERMRLLYEFCLTLSDRYASPGYAVLARDIMRFDFFVSENDRHAPDWMRFDTSEVKSGIYRAYKESYPDAGPGGISTLTRIEGFEADILLWIDTGEIKINGPRYIQFHYGGNENTYGEVIL